MNGKLSKRYIVVALLAEGVDRNKVIVRCHVSCALSPSSRRAWIEIMHQDDGIGASRVALLAEGVDRNMRKLTREHWRTAQDRVAESYKDRFGKCIGEKCMAYENGRCKRLEREGTQ